MGASAVQRLQNRDALLDPGGMKCMLWFQHSKSLSRTGAIDGANEAEHLQETYSLSVNILSGLPSSA